MSFRCRAKALLCLAGLALSVLAGTAAPETELWYGQPATKWTEALPLGNGRLGAMVFGGVAEERIQFNEDTVWKGKPHVYARADAHTVFPELRRLVAAGETEAAVKLGKERFLSDPRRQLPYQPFGDLWLRQDGAVAEPGTYRRNLDLARGTASTVYRVAGAEVRRVVRVSAPDQLLQVEWSCATPQALRVGLTSPHAGARTETLPNGLLRLTGAVQEDGVRFCALVEIKTDGQVLAQGGEWEVKGATTLTLRLAGATNVVDFQTLGADAEARASAILVKAAAYSATEVGARQ